MRQKFIFNGQTIYQWEQDIDQVNVYIQPPKACLPKYKSQLLTKGINPPKMEVQIKSNHLKIGILGNPPFINQPLAGVCDSQQSLWMIQQEELHIILAKAQKAILWPSVFTGHGKLDPMKQNQVQKQMLLQRFQQQHPGFDFSSAQMNGMVPNPRNFLGGVSYK